MQRVEGHSFESCAEYRLKRAHRTLGEMRKGKHLSEGEKEKENLRRFL